MQGWQRLVITTLAVSSCFAFAQEPGEAENLSFTLAAWQLWLPLALAAGTVILAFLFSSMPRWVPGTPRFDFTKSWTSITGLVLAVSNTSVFAQVSDLNNENPLTLLAGLYGVLVLLGPAFFAMTLQSVGSGEEETDEPPMKGLALGFILGSFVTLSGALLGAFLLPSALAALSTEDILPQGWKFIDDGLFWITVVAVVGLAFGLTKRVLSTKAQTTPNAVDIVQSQLQAKMSSSPDNPAFEEALKHLHAVETDLRGGTPALQSGPAQTSRPRSFAWI